MSSIETTSLVKELGAKHVVSVASRDIHAKLLLKNGADEVIYPDRDIAYRLAKKCSRSHIFEYIELSDEYAIFEVPVIPQLVGKSIREADVRKKYKMNIIGIVSGGEIEIINVHTDSDWTDMLSRVINGRIINYNPEHMKKYHGFPGC